MWSWPNHSIANINPNFQTPSHFSVSAFPPSSSTHQSHSVTPSSQQQSIPGLPFHSPGYQQPDYTNQSSSFGYQSSHGAWQTVPPHHVDSSPSSLLPPPPPPPSLPVPPPPPSSLHHQAQNEQFLSQKHHHDLALNNSAPLHLATRGGVSLATGGIPMAGGDGRYHNSGSSIPFSVDFILQKSAAAGQEITSGYTMGGGVGVGGASIEQQYISDTPTGYGLDYHIEENKGHYDTSSLGVGVGGAYHRETRPQETIPSQSYDRPSDQYTERLQAPPTYPIVNNEYNNSKCEERYSPPGLILKEDGGDTKKEERLSRDQSSSSSASVSSSGKINSVTPPTNSVPNESIPAPVSPPKMADSGSSSSDDSGDASDKLTSNSFQLGLSPPPLSSNNQNVIPGVISDNDTESFPMDTAKTELPSLPPEPNGELENQPKSLSRPPPLVPVEMPSQPKTGYYDDEDDDVFLPGPPTQKRLIISEQSEKTETTRIKTPSGHGHPGASSEMESPIRNQIKRQQQQQGSGRSKGGRGKEGGDSPVMVIGRRGRAAGRVLDENKLRVPLEKGWQRVVRARVAEGNNAPRVDICYVTPCNRRLRTFPEIHRYLSSNGITDLTIDHFTFSKKVNVGMIIDEKTSPECLDNLLVHPRRGRPPKRPAHQQQQQQQVKVHVDTVSDSEGSSRISLEPHEIIKPLPTKVTSSVSTVTVPPTHSFLSHMSKDQHTITRIINTDHPDSGLHQTTTRDEAEKGTDSQNKDSTSLLLPQATPPLLASSTDWRPAPLTSPEEIAASGWGSGGTKGLTTIGSTGMTAGSRGHVITKRPRGRPKGSGLGTKPGGNLVQTSGHHVGGRKRKAKATVHILPSLTPGPVPPLTMGAPGINTGTTTTPGAGLESTSNTTGGTSSAATLLKDQSKVSVLKKQEEKEKKRQLIQANKVRKRAESTHRATQRRMSQQSRRQRERALIKQAKERVDRLNRQKEADWYQLRKSRIAKQREETNQLKARERTLKLVQEIQQREIENDRLMRLRQLEREKAEQLRRPTEDLLVNDLIELPTLTKLKWVELPPHSFADLVMVFEFSHSFDDFLEIERVPRFSELYAGLFNVTIEREEEEEEEESGADKGKRVNGLILLTMQLVKAAVHDGGSRTQTISGLPLRDVDVKEDTISEVLRLYLQNKRNPFLKNVTTILSEYPYQSLSAVDKIVVLSYLVDELLSSVSLCREVDNRMEQIATLRRNKWKISLKLKRFRSRLTDSFGVSQFQKPVLYSGRGRPPKRALLNANGGMNEDGDSSDDDGGANDPEDSATAATAGADGLAPPTAPPPEEVYNTDEDSDEDIPAEKEDLQKRVKELKKKLIFVRGRIGTLTRQMRKFPLGQDRYTRQYWNLPEMGGVLIEGQETSNNDYLDELLPRLEAEEKEREEEEEKGRPLVLDSPPHSSITAESHGNTSDVPLSSQSSPRPGGAWLTDSPAKYSDDTDVDMTNTPTKSATPIKGSTPTPFPTIHEETSSDQFSVAPPSPPKEVEPVSIPEKTQHPLEISTRHSHAQEQVAMETDSLPTGSALPESVDPSVPSTISNSSPSIVTTFSSHKTTPPPSNTPVKSATPSATPLKATTSSVSLNTAPWFSLLPRKPCELLHYINGGAIGDIQGSAAGLLNGGGGQMVVPGGYTAYVTQDGTTVLAATGQPMMQQVQVGYAVVGNTLVPQTQYIVQQGGGSSGTQYVSLPNGQIAALATGGDTGTNTNIQYTNIGGNQYAIIQQPSAEEGVAGGVVSATGNVVGGVNVESSGGVADGTGDGDTPQPRKRRRKRARDTIQQTTTGVGGGTMGGVTATGLGGATATGVGGATATGVGGAAADDGSSNASLAVTESSEQKYITLALPTGTGGETQYCQVPADPRVLSGQYSYAIMPQGDGTSQIVLIENSSLGVGVAGGSETKEVIEMEVPPATVFDNEYEGQPFKVDITLMYAEAPLPFDTKKENEVKKDEEKEKEKPLKELLQEIDNDLTNGWWTIRSPLEIDYLLRSLTMRGYREKGLHKLLQKSKESICSTLKAGLLTTPPFENQEEKPKPQIKTADSSAPEIIVVDKEQEDEKMEETSSKRTESSNSTEGVGSHDDGDDKEEAELEIEKAESQSDVVAESQSNIEGAEDVSKGVEPKSEGDIDKEVSSGKEENMEEGLEAFSVSPTSFYPSETKRLAERVMKYLKNMESRLFDAHLQIKGIIKANYQSQFLSSPSEGGGSDISLSVIFSRLLMLESCVQRRYLKPPFKEKSHGSKKTEAGGGREDKESSSPPPEPVALTKWKTSAVEATSSSQLAVCVNQLERCIAWEKSPMKVFCVVCQTGDNESLLLLCDRCDRGTHTYCCRPKLDAIPDGDWFCHNCTVNASRKIACGVCQSSRGSLLHCTQCPNVFHKRCLNPPLTKLPSLPWVCIECRREQRRKPGRPRGAKDDLILCQSLLMDLEEQDDAWPFLEPVNRKKIPDYYRVIKKPMDFHTVKQKLREGKYPNKESLALDVRLIFDNCAFYNEDNSQIGLAGHNMRQYFEKRWTEMMLNQ